MTSADSVQGHDPHGDPLVGLCVDEIDVQAFVSVIGTAALSQDTAALLHWATALDRRATWAQGAPRR